VKKTLNSHVVCSKLVDTDNISGYG